MGHRARISRRNQQEADRDIVHVREGDTDAWPLNPFCSVLGCHAVYVTNRQQGRGVCGTAMLLPSMACSAGGPLRRRHRVIACLPTGPGGCGYGVRRRSFVAGIDRVRRSSEGDSLWGTLGPARTNHRRVGCRRPTSLGVRPIDPSAMNCGLLLLMAWWVGGLGAPLMDCLEASVIEKRLRARLVIPE